MSQLKTNGTAKQEVERPALTMRALIPFFAIAFGVGWGLVVLLILMMVAPGSMCGIACLPNRLKRSSAR